MKPAIAYIRVSSEDQVSGNGIDRQREKLDEYCRRNALQLVEEPFVDEGRSAFKGHHLVGEGKLGKLFAEIEAGKYKGHALLVEYLDRLSRQGVTETFSLIGRLRKADIELHETQTSRVIRSLDDLGTGIMALVDAYHGQEYSRKLSVRIGAAWAKKRANAAEGKILSKIVPVWLQVVDGKIVPIPEKVALVQEVYRLANLGLGFTRIAHKLGITRAWVSKVLRSRKVLGEYSPDAPTYYPQIISQSLWDTTREQAAQRRKSWGGSNVSHTHNLFSGLFYDVTAKRSLYYQHSRKGSYIRNDQHSLRYDKFEAAFHGFLEDLDWKSVAGETESDEVKLAQRKLEQVLGDIDKANRRIEAKTEAMDNNLDAATLKVLAGQIAKDDEKVAGLVAEKDTLQLNLQAARARCEALHTPEELLKLIGQNDLRLRLRAEIRKRIARIDFNFSSEKGPVCFIWFVNQANRMIDFRNGEAIPGYQRSFERSMVSSEQITPLLGVMAKPRSKKTTKVETSTAPAPVAANDQLHADFLAKHKATPIIFTERQKDGKRYNAVLAATSLESVDMSFFKDKKDLKTFVRWILRGAPGHKPPTAKVAAA